MDAAKLTDTYGIYTFNDDVMKERLPKSIYRAFHDSIKQGETLTNEVATAVANAMKVWAVELGATHFTHWFTPMTGLAAEKHDAFLEPTSDNHAILEFSGKALRKGEPDASSFPTGGLRATFEARGYTAWDCTSPAFVKDKALYIPTLFYSYTGEALDLKTPLLRSCDALSKEATKLLHLLGLEDVKKVTPNAGCEQEYFLIDRKYYEQRLDLMLTGRTLFGAKPPKGQELEDHYFGNIKRRVAKFMQELDTELWKLGIPSKTKHNEVAPSQHEIACVYRHSNLTADNNLIVMELLKKIAKNHDLICLLHEKPFNCVNGSGKHNNWSITTDTGINLFNPSEHPLNNIPFLATLACTIKAVDDYADFIRMTAASAGNDHRLGANEAPPAIISIFIGDELEQIVEDIVSGKTSIEYTKKPFSLGVSVIPTFSKDNTDRNRTSPFAFTGNKFEFRAIGSSQSISGANTVLNTILAKTMSLMVEELEKNRSVNDIIKEYLSNHRRIIFNGDGYSEEWLEESKRRKLSNHKDTIEAIQCLNDEEKIKAFVEYGVYTKSELKSRYEIQLESYAKTIKVEALTALKIVKTQIYPSGVKYVGSLSNDLLSLINAGLIVDVIKKDVEMIASLVENIKQKSELLESTINDIENGNLSAYEMAKAYRDNVLSIMQELRQFVDTLEDNIDKNLWPMPSYTDLLFGV